MLGDIALLFVCLLGGESVHRLAGVPLPGSIIGMVLLFGWLALVRRSRPGLSSATTWLTGHLSVMFVPSAVGLVNEGPILSRYGLALAVATAVSTVLTSVVTVLVFRWTLARVSERGERHA
ncbi:holin-like protein [Arboricoccus pini]|uniref:Holin-like protein n=1 Tax=Arboricoccus pini TaxID=1963835 RepID=A0A212RWG3_9PROT|nr:CidA/LrgA family protein [Arboricoccus pini]SNB77040.1 holin-like protein [Arboricoccus pini]